MDKMQKDALYVIKALNLLDEFRGSLYSSYRWYLRAQGIQIYKDMMKIIPGTRFNNDPRAIELEMSFGVWTSQSKKRGEHE